MTELLIEDLDAVRVLYMNRPEKHNALNTALTQGLLDALQDADRDNAVRAVVLAGNGKSFCAGADTKEFAGLTAQHAAAVLQRAELTTALHLAFSHIGKPVVSAVQGNALGGGAGLALACDMSVMAEDVRFGYPELRHGIVAAVVMANLVRQVGRKQAFELVAMAEPIDGARALALGLANRVVPAAQVLETALGLARRMAGWEAAAMKLTKRS
ncbi:MAG TPA: enoyl-CoA hydratase/isomerase family protein, partial [Bordetella sp.]|nr:enoyl-CoA hydratase/isomerase family protein [Bordetella sp.]